MRKFGWLWIEFLFVESRDNYVMAPAPISRYSTGTVVDRDPGHRDPPSDIHYFRSYLVREIIRAKNTLSIPSPQ